MAAPRCFSRSPAILTLKLKDPPGKWLCIFESGNTPSPRVGKNKWGLGRALRARPNPLFIISLAPKSFEFPGKKIHHLANGQLVLPPARKYNDGVAKLQKISIPETASKLEQPFSMMDVALVGDILISVYICQGTLEWHKHLDIDELFWVHKGTILLESEWGEKQLRAGELAVVPKGVVF